MTTGLIFDETYCLHDTGRGHPERPDRIRAIGEMLRTSGVLEQIVTLQINATDLGPVRQVHDPRYIDRLKSACQTGQPFIDVSDSVICERSYEIALMAVGGVLTAVDAVMEEQVNNAFCAVRPPGHHAESDRSMGFCMFNNIAIAAEHLCQQHGLKRVAIVDFDVHHGNGTQHIFEHRSDILFISLHQDPLTCYPGTGFADETGIGKGEGYTLNLPMTPGDGDADYRNAFTQSILPALDRFKPQALLISAGFDAAAPDPLAQMNLTPEGFSSLTRELRCIADQYCDKKLISLLEGGYDLPALGRCVEAHLRALAE